MEISGLIMIWTITVLLSMNIVKSQQHEDSRNYSRVDAGLTRVSTDIPDDVTEVDLSQNLITSLGSGPFSRLSNCLELHVRENKLTEIQGENWEGLSSLLSLWLNGNRIHTVHPGAFSSLSTLEYLYLHGNGITALRADQWEGLDSLLYLQLGENGIQTIGDGSLSPLKGLTTLELFGNRMTEITAGTWEGLDSLQELRLQSNQITSVSGSFSTLPHLTWLNVQQNELETFDQDDFAPEVFSDERGFTLEMRIAGNPLQCDSRLCWLKEAEERGWVEVAKNAFLRRNCRDPVNIGKRWENAQIECDGK